MNELTTMAAALGTRLKERKETIAIAESSAGGLISAALLAVPGASAYFLGGGVIYTQAARRALLRVPDESVKGIRSSTEAYALLKARTIRELLGATWGLAETGATGPTGNHYGDSAGHACLAVAGRGGGGLAPAAGPGRAACALAGAGRIGQGHPVEHRGLRPAQGADDP